MSQLTTGNIELSLEEKKAFWRAIDERVLRLGRCRAVFDVEISETYRARSIGHPDLPARCRIVYQRANMETWQIAVFDECDNVVCDLASDGTWIEAGGKCWHKAYRYGCREAFDEEHNLTRAEQEKREDARESLEHELDHALWPLYIATEHLFLDVPFFEFLHPLSFHIRDHWEILRNQDSGRVRCRFQTDYHPTIFRFTTWEVLQWKLVRLWRPSVDIQDYFDRRSSPQTEYEIVFNESDGLTPQRYRTLNHCDSPEAEDGCEVWEAPIEMDGGRFVPQVYTSGPSAQDGEPHLRSTLVVEESAFGVNIPLNIRPVDRTKELVDW